MKPNIDILKDFSKLQADVNSLSKSNVALVNKVYKLQEERDLLKEQLESHGPEGHNCTNLQVFTIRTKLDKWRECAERLAAFIQHKRGCDTISEGITVACDCGKDEVLAEFDRLREETK